MKQVSGKAIPSDPANRRRFFIVTSPNASVLYSSPNFSKAVLIEFSQSDANFSSTSAEGK